MNVSSEDEICSFLILISSKLIVSTVVLESKLELLALRFWFLVLVLVVVSISRSARPTSTLLLVVWPSIDAVPRFKFILLVRFCVRVLDLLVEVLILLSGSWIVLTQVSTAGFNSISPVYTTTWNGLTFSTVVAIGCSIQSISSYFKVTESPVFWTFGSNKSKLLVKSKLWGIISSICAICDLREFLLIIGINSSAVGLICMEDNGLSIKE